MRDWLRRLVVFQTVSGSASNLDLIEHIDERLRSIDFDTRLTRSADGRRANLLASIGGSDGGLLLAGHTDVVPVEGQAWSRPAFSVSEDDDHFYGRGVCDMKGYLACVLAAVEAIDLKRLQEPLHLAFTYDEEIGCVGVRDLLRDMANAGIKPASCMVGEPTQMKVVRAHKGRHAYRCHVLGRAAHSSFSGTGVNALEVACRLATHIADEAESLMSAVRDEGFYVPYSTMASCRMQSGHVSNAIPESAEFDFDLRYLPQSDPDSILASLRTTAARLESSMRAKVPTSAVTIKQRTAVPALVPSPASAPVLRRALAAGASAGEHVAFTTEGGLYQTAGMATVICGPGNIAQAHTADEFIAKSQLTACEHFLHALLLP